MLEMNPCMVRVAHVLHYKRLHLLEGGVDEQRLIGVGDQLLYRCPRLDGVEEPGASVAAYPIQGHL